MTYKEFLKKKELESIHAGFEVDPRELNENLFDFQRDIVAWALQKGKAAIFSDCGSGKSIMQLDFAYQVCRHTGKDALVVAPLAVVGQTKKEGEKFGIDVHVCRTQEDVLPGINITNYEMLEHFNASAFESVVLDECFSPDTKVETIDENGNTNEKKISEIIPGDKVKNCTGIDDVIATRRKKVSYGIRVQINGSKVVCSPRNPFFTQRGWVCAKDLQKGDACISTDKAMRILRKDFSDRMEVGLAEEILQQILLCEMENESARDKGKSSYERDSRKDREESIEMASQYTGWKCTDRENTKFESDGKSRNESKSICEITGDTPRTFKAWGQWAWDDIATAVDDGCIARRLDSGITYLTGKETARIPNVLQSRLRELGNENCHRDRWELSSFEKNVGREEGRKTGIFRVESFEILEQGCSELDKYRDADGSLYFYDLEIKRHPSFTVNGCLVHNSSILKSFTSSTRNELIDKFARTPYKLACTATPSPNDHSELGNHAEFLGIMSRSEMLATYFIHDSGDTSKWRLKGYGEKSFGNGSRHGQYV